MLLFVKSENLVGPTFLTKIFVTRFLKRAPKRSGIVNVESAAGFAPLPYMQIYASTKCYGRSFTLALNEELKDKIDVLTFSPAGVQTKMSYGLFGPGVASPENCADAIFKDLGHEREVTPILSHDLQIGIVIALKRLSDSFFLSAIYYSGILITKLIARFGLSNK